MIGHNNAMPWRQSSDLKHFKRLTYGKPVIMGRKTFASIGRPLPGRDNIILTQNTDFQAPSARVVYSVEEAKSWAVTYAHERNVEDAAVIGGAEIYKLFWDSVSRIYLTEIHEKIDGDTKFLKFDRSEWNETLRKRHVAGSHDDHDFSFVILDRI